MADQHNDSIPAMANQISADIPDIKENLEFHKDAFQLLFETWSDTDNSSNVLDSALGFSDGTYTYDFPTNGVAGNSIIMLGNSDTIVWMYLNTAPPGWKALSTGADTVIAVAGGTGDYNVNGGNPDSAASWEIDGFTAAAEATHTHTYSVTPTTSTPSATASTGSGEAAASGTHTHTVTVSGTTSAGASHTHAISHDSTYRPSASVGKLFQLDTA